MRVKKASFVLLVAFMILATFLLLSAYSVLVPVAVAYAEEETPVEETAETTDPVVIVEKTVVQEVESDDWVTVFKKEIFPLIIAGGEVVGGFIALLIINKKKNGKLFALQGAYSSQKGIIDTFSPMLKDITPDNIIAKAKDELLPALKAEIFEELKVAIKDNVKDTTGDIAKLQTDMSVLSAQLTAFVKAALIAWGESPEIREILAKSPTAEVLTNLYGTVKTLREMVEGQNAEAIKPLDDMIKELGVYGNENE